MVDTAVEIVCKACGEKFWYSGDRSYPGTVECPDCGTGNLIPEDG